MLHLTKNYWIWIGWLYFICLGKTKQILLISDAIYSLESCKKFSFFLQKKIILGAFKMMIWIESLIVVCPSQSQCAKSIFI